jgi:hypothetical protein
VGIHIQLQLPGAASLAASSGGAGRVQQPVGHLLEVREVVVRCQVANHHQPRAEPALGEGVLQLPSAERAVIAQVACCDLRQNNVDDVSSLLQAGYANANANIAWFLVWNL